MLQSGGLELEVRKSMPEIEQGPIRPPSEAQSLLLRVTRNCSWNRCEFCSIYKKHRFSPRTVEEVKKEIDSIEGIVSESNPCHGIGDLEEKSTPLWLDLF